MSKKILPFILIKSYWDEIQEKSKKIRLVGFDTKEEWEKIIVDLLELLNQLRVKKRIKNSFFLDIGSGSGIPGVLFAWIFSDANISLLESNHKKCNFLRSLPRKIFQGKIIEARSEEVGHKEEFRESFEFVTSYKYAPLPIALETGSAFCRVGGELWVFGGYEKIEESKVCKKIEKILGLKMKGYYSLKENIGVLIYQKESVLDVKKPRRWKAMKRSVSRETL